MKNSLHTKLAIAILLYAANAAGTESCERETQLSEPVYIELRGHGVVFPFKVRYVTVPSEYRGQEFVQLRREVRIDFGGYRDVWPSLARSLLPPNDFYHRRHPHGFSVGAKENGALLSRLHVTYENWGKWCAKVLEFHRWKPKWVVKCATTRHFEATGYADLWMRPRIEDGEVKLAMDVKTSGGDLPWHLSVVSDMFTLGQLEKALLWLRKIAAEKARNAIQAQLDSAEEQVAAELRFMQDATQPGSEEYGFVNEDARFRERTGDSLAIGHKSRNKAWEAREYLLHAQRTLMMRLCWSRFSRVVEANMASPFQAALATCSQGMGSL